MMVTLAPTTSMINPFFGENLGGIGKLKGVQLAVFTFDGNGLAGFVHRHHTHAMDFFRFAGHYMHCNGCKFTGDCSRGGAWVDSRNCGCTGIDFRFTWLYGGHDNLNTHIQLFPGGALAKGRDLEGGSRGQTRRPFHRLTSR